MADLVTANYGWVKPNVNDPAGVDLWGGKLNADLDGIDAQVFLNAQGVAALNAANLGGFINKLRNPGFDIWQRSSPVNIAAGASVYGPDGWYVAVYGAATTVQRQPLNSTWPQGVGCSAAVVTGAAGITSVQFVQRIESYVAAALAGQVCTFSILAYSQVAQTPQVQLSHPSTADTPPWSNTDFGPVNLQPVPASTFTRLAYTFVMPAASAYNGLQLNLIFPSGLGAGNNLYVAAADLRATPGLPVGLCANPPPPELRPAAIEVQFCYRYYWQSPGNVMCAGYNAAGAQIISQLLLPNRMRGIPTIVLGTPSYANASGMAVNYIDAAGFRLSAVVTASGAAWAAANPLTLSAEL
jgi:hypothetical protein